jgi:threonine synthase
MVGHAETSGTKISIAQAGGCDPIATAILEGGDLEPQSPDTAVHSLAIGSPGDGPLVIDAVRTRGGSAGTVTDPEVFEAIDLLGATEGILTEPAGGTTIASLGQLAAQGKIAPDETVVAIISGNGLKTIQDHPDKAWPEMVACDLESMSEQLADFRRTAAAV